MIPINITELKKDMVILSEDSYGNDVFVVTKEPYLDESGLISVEVREVVSNSETILAENPAYPAYGLDLYRIL